ncbi:uncharacterized protein EI90DRAFT_957360 [Cantharellus anzutake]|uniref:uncharacterized protein n=1 Tax=Cantharellus anzutake TaxID=1750568 RepID=UPI0019068535|nr:uncharacterized protein EI90DRAFT_957360 [Cantharellus anzutake]KAF8331661.1 hypothetical protein EI90DRAFT_957360 [Cantharellus anzutake]
MWGIVYSCLLTVFACIWTAVHPNVPKHYYGAWSFRSPRVGFTLLSLLSPEIILVFAWRDFFKSWEISKKCRNVEGWTFTHSYFVAMHGFFDPSAESALGYRDDLQRYPGIIEKSGNARKAAITKEEILDRSKGDPFAKSIIVLQLQRFAIELSRDQFLSRCPKTRPTKNTAHLSNRMS